MITTITELDRLQRENAELLRVLNRIVEIYDAPFKGTQDRASQRACDMRALAKTAVCAAEYYAKQAR